METIIYKTETSSKTKATNDSKPRTTPFVFILAKEMRSEATTISPIPMKEAHILSRLLNAITLGSNGIAPDYSI
jgi:hypothetical protein